jgi:hypothetical protein
MDSTRVCLRVLGRPSGPVPAEISFRPAHIRIWTSAGLAPCRLSGSFADCLREVGALSSGPEARGESSADVRHPVNDGGIARDAFGLALTYQIKIEWIRVQELWAILYGFESSSAG